jgi:putative holliday junction resolvase
MRLVGIDYGTKRVGMAISDDEGNFALPSGIISNDSSLLGNIKQFCLDKGASAIVIGESRDLSGKENSIMGDIKLLKEAIERDLRIPVYFEPEFYTSAEAERVQGKNKMHDASAAALILKSYIERHSHGNS